MDGLQLVVHSDCFYYFFIKHLNQIKKSFFSPKVSKRIYYHLEKKVGVRGGGAAMTAAAWVVAAVRTVQLHDINPTRPSGDRQIVGMQTDQWVLGIPVKHCIPAKPC